MYFLVEVINSLRSFSRMEQALADTLKCPLCLDFANLAVETNCCSQVYCQKCLCELGDKKCPNCQEENVTSSPNNVVRKMVANIPTVCPNECGETTTKGEVEKHLEICSKRVFSCPSKDCQFTGFKEAFVKHLNTVHERAMLHNVTEWLKVRVEPPLPEEQMVCCFSCDFESGKNAMRTHIIEEHGYELASAMKHTNYMSCFIANCSFVGTRDAVQEHIMETHERELASAMKHMSYISDTEPFIIRNIKGRQVEMADNGKFYCGKSDSIGYHKQSCTSSSMSNCADCMKMDVLLRNLPYGSLVNKNGRICRTNLCCHESRNRGDFASKGTRPALCRPSVCGTGPTYSCKDFILVRYCGPQYDQPHGRFCDTGNPYAPTFSRNDLKQREQNCGHQHVYSCGNTNPCDACQDITYLMGSSEKNEDGTVIDTGMYYSVWDE